MTERREIIPVRRRIVKPPLKHEPSYRIKQSRENEYWDAKFWFVDSIVPFCEFGGDKIAQHGAEDTA